MLIDGDVLRFSFYDSAIDILDKTPIKTYAVFPLLPVNFSIVLLLMD